MIGTLIILDDNLMCSYDEASIRIRVFSKHKRGSNQVDSLSRMHMFVVPEFQKWYSLSSAGRAFLTKFKSLV